jgi:hypothetical protein
VKQHNPADDAPGRRLEAAVISELENRLRTAFRAQASDVSVPPLQLPLQAGAARTPARTKWIASVAAAICMFAIIGGALAVAGALPGRQSASAGRVETKVPPYYVALIASQPTPYSLAPAGAAVAEVRVTSTGAVVASVTAPKPYKFGSVTAAADDRSFVVLGVGPATISATSPHYESYAQRFFRLHINPAASTRAARAQLTMLPHAGIARGLYVAAMALSASGQSLAVIFTDPSRAIGAVVPGQLTIFNLADGTRRTWIRKVCGYGRCAPGPIGGGSIVVGQSAVQLSWTADGQSLLFLSGPEGTQARLLDVDAPGRDLIAASRALPVRTAFPNWNDAAITPDGQSVFIEYSTLSGLVTRDILLRVSATTGKTAAVVQVPGNASRPVYLLWTNDNGSKFVVFRPDTGTPGQAISPGQAAIYSGGRSTPLRWPRGVVDAAW